MSDDVKVHSALIMQFILHRRRPFRLATWQQLFKMPERPPPVGSFIHPSKYVKRVLSSRAFHSYLSPAETLEVIGRGINPQLEAKLEATLAALSFSVSEQQKMARCEHHQLLALKLI